VSESHDWLLVAPWYRWPRQAKEKRAPRRTRPVLQKYDDSTFVDAFLADPQRSLVWTVDDRVQKVTALEPKRLTSGPLKPRLAESAVADPGKPGRFTRYLATPTTTRKLFLDAHQRFYLVVCELHCDVPGFPRAHTDEVCQAGFVVRRRFVDYPEAAEPEAGAILKELSLLQLKLAKLDRVPSARRATKRWELLAPQKQNGEVEAERQTLKLAIAKQQNELLQWAKKNGATPAQLGWVAGERRHVGSWQVVENEPQTLLEETYPLYPLVPDPGDAEHSGQGSTIYFGVVPTGSSDHNPVGASRYDDRHLYEIRCFVRRHKPACPRTLEPNDCNGALYWSLPTEAFQLASHFDPVGTAHRPVNITLPDFPALAAAAAARPIGALAPVAMSQPDNSTLKFSPDVPPKSGSVEPQGQICFLAIPLITIVAWFVLNLFLPIVVFVFGLWFLLRLKICIPPSLAVQAAVDAQLVVDGQLGLAAEAGLDVDVAVAGAFSATKLNDSLAGTIGATVGGTGTATYLKANYGNTPLIEMDRALAKPQKGPDFGAGIEWEPPVVRADAEVLVA
jgi:hypothetical protein